MQIISDVTQRKVEAVAHPQEAGALGIALAAAVGLGVYPDFAALKQVVHVERTFKPQPQNAQVYDVMYRTYRRLYASLKDLYRDVNQVRFEK
jgi:sugar (pentulose or hexulose) kinase